MHLLSRENRIAHLLSLRGVDSPEDIIFFLVDAFIVEKFL